MEQKIKQSEIEQVSMHREIQQASADAHFWKERALAAESKGWSPRNSGWPTFPPPIQPQFPPQSSGDQFGLSGGPPTGQNTNASPFFLTGRGRGRGRRGGYMYTTAGSTDRTPPDTCRLCRNKGHWARECPNRNAESAAEAQVKTNVSEVVENDLNVCSSETYLDITFKVGSKNRAVMCLLDTGCAFCLVNMHVG